MNFDEMIKTIEELVDRFKYVDIIELLHSISDEDYDDICEKLEARLKKDGYTHYWYRQPIVDADGHLTNITDEEYLYTNDNGEAVYKAPTQATKAMCIICKDDKTLGNIRGTQGFLHRYICFDMATKRLNKIVKGTNDEVECC